MKITASACANGVGLHEKPTPAIRMHAIASHSVISRLERDDWLLIFSFFEVIVPLPCARYCTILVRLIRWRNCALQCRSGASRRYILSPAGSHRQAHWEPRRQGEREPIDKAWAVSLGERSLHARQIRRFNPYTADRREACRIAEERTVSIRTYRGLVVVLQKT